MELPRDIHSWCLVQLDHLRKYRAAVKSLLKLEVLEVLEWYHQYRQCHLHRLSRHQRQVGAHSTQTSQYSCLEVSSDKSGILRRRHSQVWLC